MNLSFYTIHDDVVLWLVQELFYAHSILSMTVMFVVLVCLPRHRLLARMLGWVAMTWALVCLLYFGALTEAPLLGWFLLALLAYRFLCWVFWVLPDWSEVKGRGAKRFWLRPRAGWCTSVVRDYFRCDPRGVYWLDMARAVRGVPQSRTAAQRRAVLLTTPGCPAWRQQVWQVIFRMIDLRIQLYRRLPGCWCIPHDRVDLDEANISAIVELESEEAHREMIREWTGQFTEYYARDPATHQLAMLRAGLYGRKSCLMREALAESIAFASPFRPNEKLLLKAALLRYRIWQRRRQFDLLWDEASSPSDASRDREVETPAPEFADDDAEFPVDRPRSEEEPSGNGQWEENTAEDEKRQRQDDMAAEDFPHESKVGLAESDDDQVLSMGSTATATHAEDTAVASPEHAIDDDSELSSEAVEAGTVTAELGEAASDDAMPSDAGAAVDAEPTDEITDEELFQVADEQLRGLDALELAEEAGDGEDLDWELPLCERERRTDLRTASELLEAYLEFSPTMEFAEDVALLEQMLDNPSRQVPVTMLLLLYCLRTDHAGDEVDRQKVKLLTRLENHFADIDTNDPRLGNLRRLFATMYVDVLIERHDWSRILEYFSQHTELGTHEWKILADAEAAVARSLPEQNELRDMLRYDAIGHYFQAGFCGIWTVEYARVLLDNVGSLEEVYSLLQEHPVAIARPGALNLNVRRATGNAPSLPETRSRTAALGARVNIMIVISSTVDPSRKLPLKILELPFTMGRGPGVNQPIRARLAPRHIELLQYRGRLVVRDLSGRNDLKVNKRPTRACGLVRGDQVQFGDLLMRVVSI